MLNKKICQQCFKKGSYWTDADEYCTVPYLWHIDPDFSEYIVKKYHPIGEAEEILAEQKAFKPNSTNPPYFCPYTLEHLVNKV